MGPRSAVVLTHYPPWLRETVINQRNVTLITVYRVRYIHIIIEKLFLWRNGRVFGVIHQRKGKNQ